MTLAPEDPVATDPWGSLPLTPEHQELLRSAAISPQVAAAAGLYSITSVEQIPPEFAPYGQAVLPSLAFPYRSPAGEARTQLRPDVPVQLGGRPSKYLWPADTGLVLNAVRSDPDAGMVLIVEGTKQALTMASHAPKGVEVLGMVGCRGWYRDGAPSPDLAVCDDREVVVVLDADAATNLDVYTAGMDLAEAVTAEGARSVKFVRLPGGKKTGLDDILGSRPAERRAAYLARLIETAKAKPADAKPKPKPAKQRNVNDLGETAGTTGRPMIFVDGDRWDVINELTRVLRERWNLTRLFNHGDVISQLRGTEMKPLTEGTFLDLLQETAAIGRQVLDRDGQPVGVTYGWPDSQTIKAVMSRADRFAKLDLVARAPFVRPDGTVCLANGYDEQTRAMVVMDEVLASIHVPEFPTEEDVAQARKLILDEWLGDFPFPDEANRANALALVLTPFVRSMMAIVPLAVVDGLAPGVGKNLLVDCVLLMFLGEKPELMGFNPDDDEFRKTLTAAFRSGAEVFVFDEAHHIEGVSLARALTAAYWKDRKLTTNQLLGFPNRATWIAMGNNVRVEGDIFRRVYRIALRPLDENPEDRPTEGFRHPDLEGWTRDNRAELLQAALILVRAWFAAGQPHPSRSVAFGSFERWARVLGGILDVAGQPDFLGNLKAWRSESNLVPSYWASHLTWLRGTFGGDEFTASDVRSKLATDADPEYPPIRGDLADKATYAKTLGEAYSKIRDRSFQGLRIRQAIDTLGKQKRTRTGRALWLIEAPEPGEGRSGAAGSPNPSGSPDSPQDGAAGSPNPSGSPGSSAGAAETAETSLPPTHARKNVSSICATHDDANARTWLGGSGGLSGLCSLSEPDEPDANPSTHIDSDSCDRVDLASFERQATITLPDGVVAFDIESSGNQLFPKTDGFIRITGIQTGNQIHVTADAAQAARTLAEARMVVGHNIMSFDLMAFALHHGLDIHAMAREDRIVDTMLTEIVTNPPMPQEGKKRKKPEQLVKDYALDKLGGEKFGEGKVDHLPALAKEFGGFDRIPVDERRYVTYCAGDVDLTSRLAASQRWTAYVRREHRVAAIAAQISLNGFRVDVEELLRRVEAGNQRKREQREHLYGLGMPQVNAQGKPVTYPHRTKPGKELITRLFAELGVTPRYTDKGNLALDSDNLAALGEQYRDRPEVLAIIEPIQALNGVRTVYETALEHLKGDRVHPQILMVQASGRWSVTKPGLTVFGKRGGRHHEREIFTPEPGHVIISADLAQVDARAVAAWCQDPAYLDLFEPGRDSHTEIAIKVWGDPGRRADAKVIGHGWNYGMGITRLAQACGSDQAAREFDTAMRQQFPRLVAWKDQVREQAKAGPLDNGFGRIMRCEPGWEYTQAPALMGQGTARDLMMEGLLRLPVEILPMLRAVVHDEIVLSIPEDQADNIEHAVLDALSFEWAPPGASRPVRIEAGLGKHRGRNWGHVYEGE